MTSLTSTGEHHKHIRKRVHHNLEPFPHPDKYKKFLDKIIYAAGIFGPLMTIPQVYNIWIEQTTAGVSIISWSAYLLCALIWVLYGFVHKEKPIIIMNILWVIFDALIIIGVLIY